MVINGIECTEREETAFDHVQDCIEYHTSFRGRTVSVGDVVEEVASDFPEVSRARLTSIAYEAARQLERSGAYASRSPQPTA